MYTIMHLCSILLEELIMIRCIETNETYYGVSEAVKQTGLTQIKNILKYPDKTAGGFHWEYV